MQVKSCVGVTLHQDANPSVPHFCLLAVLIPSGTRRSTISGCLHCTSRRSLVNRTVWAGTAMCFHLGFCVNEVLSGRRRQLYGGSDNARAGWVSSTTNPVRWVILPASVTELPPHPGQSWRRWGGNSTCSIESSIRFATKRQNPGGGSEKWI